MTELPAPSNGPAESPRAAAGSLSDQIGQNIDSVVALQKRKWQQTSKSQRQIERIGRFIGRPTYLIGVLVFSCFWVGSNVGAILFGFSSLDPPPFAILQGLLTLVALITTTIVLIAQNRQTKLEQEHMHLDLQVNLLTEQKVTKLILLIEELRRDLPMVKDRHDPHSALLQQGADTAQVLSALEQVGLTDAADDEAPA